jgi:hypothetical protein
MVPYLAQKALPPRVWHQVDRIISKREQIEELASTPPEVKAVSAVDLMMSA